MIKRIMGYLDHESSEGSLPESKALEERDYTTIIKQAFTEAQVEALGTEISDIFDRK
jgi:hypothetical protein